MVLYCEGSVLLSTVMLCNCVVQIVKSCWVAVM